MRFQVLEHFSMWTGRAEDQNTVLHLLIVTQNMPFEAAPKSI